MKDFIDSLNRDIPEHMMETLLSMTDKRKVMKYCKQYPMLKVKPKVVKKVEEKPKSKVVLPVKEKKEE